MTLCKILLGEIRHNPSLSYTLQLTVMNAGRKYLSLSDLTGKVFLSSGLGGMSGAQAKAAVIAGCIGVISEVTL
jgi:urocanate hydratase